MTKGNGFHGDFINGWDEDVLAAGIQQCAVGDTSGVVENCAPFLPSDISDFSTKCPTEPPIINEPVLGMIDKLPGCITITDGPEEATPADITCNTAQPEPRSTTSTEVSSATGLTNPNPVDGYVYIGCWNELTGGKRALNASEYTDSKAMTVESCVSYCETRGHGFAGVEYSQE